MNPIHRLTAAQFQVLLLIKKGKTNKEIALARQTHISNIEQMISRIYRILNVTNRVEAALYKDDEEQDYK